jgi:hypothetical protein
MKYRLKVLWTSFLNIFKKKYVGNVCKHRTLLSGEIRAQSEGFLMKMPLEENGSPEYCLECIGKMSIRCAWCGEPIFIGDPVTLYKPVETFDVPEYAVPYGDSKCFVGCLRATCADGCDRAGFWVPPGEVYRVPTPIEMALHSGKPVVVHDLSDINNIGKIIEIE